MLFTNSTFSYFVYCIDSSQKSPITMHMWITVIMYVIRCKSVRYKNSKYSTIYCVLLHHTFNPSISWLKAVLFIFFLVYTFHNNLWFYFSSFFGPDPVLILPPLQAIFKCFKYIFLCVCSLLMVEFHVAKQKNSNPHEFTKQAHSFCRCCIYSLLKIK